MELKCPSCLNVLNTERLSRNCPACGAVIEVLEHDGGLTLLSAQKHDIPPPENPVAAGYEKWRGRAVFIALAGGALIWLVLLDLNNSYRIYGRFFWKNGQNLTFPVIAGSVAAFLVIAGCWLFRFVGKHRKK